MLLEVCKRPLLLRNIKCFIPPAAINENCWMQRAERVRKGSRLGPETLKHSHDAKSSVNDA